MIETLTTAAISLAGLAGLAFMYGVLIPDQNKRIERIKKDVFSMEKAQRSNYARLGILEKGLDHAAQGIDLKEENTQLKESRSWDYEYIVKVNEENKRLEGENEQLKQDLLRTEELQDEIIQLEKDFEIKDNLLSELSEHVGNKPSSSTYKYFRGKLDGLGIVEHE